MPRPDRADVLAELAAMRKLFTVLDKLDEDAQRRVMTYLVDRYNRDVLASRPTRESADV